MRNRCIPVVVVCLAALLAGCGDSDASPPDPVHAESCVDLADKYVEIAQELLDSIGELTPADMSPPPPEVETAGEEWFAEYSELVPRIGQLCEEAEFDALLCERESQLESFGEEGEHFLDDNYPSCDG